MDKPTIKLAQGATEEDAIRQIEAWIMEWLAMTLKLGRDRLDLDTGFMDLGLDSVDAIFMLSELEANLQVKLDTSLLLECPTGRVLAPRVAQAWATRPETAPAL